MKKLSYRNDFNPISVWIIDKIDSHRRIFIADAAHLLVKLVGSLIVVHGEAQVDFIVPQVVGLFPVPQPGELQLKAGDPVPR